VTSVGTARAGILSEGAGKAVAAQIIASVHPHGNEIGGPEWAADGVCR